MSRRTVIVGGPRTGKTTLAAKLDGPVKHTDDLIGVHDWSGTSKHLRRARTAATPSMTHGPGSASHTSAMWLAANPAGKPCETVVHTMTPKVPLTGGQLSMSKGHAKIWREVEPELRARGVLVEASP